MTKRQEHVNKFYSLMNELEKIDPKKELKNCNGYTTLPKQGVYFFFEKNELRENGNPKIVRIGTHAVSIGSKTKFWSRLRQHKGTKEGTGNHRSSVFRQLVGKSVINKYGLTDKFPEWGIRKINKQNKTKEIELEIKVSKIIGEMEFLSLSVPGSSRKDNMRAFIETNSIALLSNKDKSEKIDLPSKSWLGNYSNHNDVLDSGLWNSDDTDKIHDPKFLDKLEELISKHKYYMLNK